MSLVEQVLKILSNIDGTINSVLISEKLGEDHQKIVGALKSIQALGDIVTADQLNVKRWELTGEGKEIAANGSHEAAVYNAVPPEGIAQKDLMQKVPNAKVGFSKAMSAGWIKMDKSENPPKVFRKVESIVDEVQDCLNSVLKDPTGDTDMSESQKQDLKKRKLLQEITIKCYEIGKGPSFSTSVSKPETDLTPDMIVTGSWKDKQFKAYNFNALGVPPDCGHLHPLLKVRSEFRRIFLEMGFSEMPTNNYIESSFWNFDALFQPQQHPARDAQDTFFLSDPANAREFPNDYLERVKMVHSVGGYGSQGIAGCQHSTLNYVALVTSISNNVLVMTHSFPDYPNFKLYKCEWKEEEAAKNVLRTHTTAVSARMLYKLGQEYQETKIFRPVKYFSIDRVFRNESLDATHLAEFHQIEGVVADIGLTLGDLMGVLQQFFEKMGIEQIRFKPAYNPYTEPSMEIFSYHKGLKKWVEVGNSGVFRPEMLLPMGLPNGVSVIAWGLSLERPTMIKYGIDNIRDLVGPKVDLQMVYDNPICRLDK